jgi:hypothetical protein
MAYSAAGSRIGNSLPLAVAAADSVWMPWLCYKESSAPRFVVDLMLKRLYARTLEEGIGQ